jgi:signal transduction histidine kinase
VLASQPQQSATTLDAIGDTGRRAISELRIMLGVLRDTDRDPEAVQAFDIGMLMEPVRRTGLTVELIESGDGGPIPAPLRLTAYRLVQEALTNVLKHATASRVVVTVCHGRDGLTLEVVDDGAGLAPATGQQSPGSGRGLSGMAERVRAHGGRFEAGRLTPQGFRVLAELPAAAGRGVVA